MLDTDQRGAGENRAVRGFSDMAALEPWSVIRVTASAVNFLPPFLLTSPSSPKERVWRKFSMVGYRTDISVSFFMVSGFSGRTSPPHIWRKSGACATWA